MLSQDIYKTLALTILSLRSLKYMLGDFEENFNFLSRKFIPTVFLFLNKFILQTQNTWILNLKVISKVVTKHRSNNRLER